MRARARERTKRASTTATTHATLASSATVGANTTRNSVVVVLAWSMTNTNHQHEHPLERIELVFVTASRWPPRSQTELETPQGHERYCESRVHSCVGVACV